MINHKICVKQNSEEKTAARKMGISYLKSNGELQYYILMLGASCCTNLMILYSKDGLDESLVKSMILWVAVISCM
jgi:hypothetical protein